MSKSKTLTTQEVEHIAKLVALSLTDEEIALFAKEMPETINYIENLNDLDTRATPPTYQTSGNVNRFLNEAVGERTLSPEKAVASALESKQNLFKIKAFDYSK